MKKIASIFLLLVLSCADSYREFKITPLSNEMNTVYLKDSLRYLSLTTAQPNIIKATFNENTVSTPTILQFPAEGIRVLIIKDQRHFTQTVNIVALQNSVDLFKARNAKMVQTNLFTFPVNAHLYKIYKGIRKNIIKSLEKNYSVRINTLGSSSAYGLMLGVEISALEMPLESIVSFGASRFASQETQDQLKQSFGSRLVNITHEEDLSHKLYMGSNYAEHTLGQHLVCQQQLCNESIYTLENISLQTLTKHISNFPRTYAELYHNSITYMETAEKRRPSNTEY